MDITTLVTAAGIFISVVLASIISYRVASVSAKKSDLDIVRDSYAELQKTYGTENFRLNNALEVERNARTKAELSCQAQITELQKQLTALLGKLPEPGAVLPVKIIAAEVALPVEVVRPLPLPMTAAQVAQVAAQVAEAVSAAPSEPTEVIVVNPESSPVPVVAPKKV